MSAPLLAQDDVAYRLLVAVSSSHPIQAELFRGIDWDALLLQARHHSLMPMLAHRLLDSMQNALPAQVRARLRSEFQSNLLRNFGFFEEIRRILELWREAGIEAIPYKGPALAEQLWGSFALRECCDLDFLVRREDVQRAGKALANAGYQPEAQIANSLRPALLRDASEEQFRHSPSKILVELQWAPAPRTLAVHFEEQGLWNRTAKVAIAGETVTAPCPEDLFALLAIHGWKHNWSKLVWIADLAALMRRNQIDWDALYRQATEGRWRRILMLAMEMVRRVYGVQPEFPHLSHSDLQLRELADRLEQNLRFARENRYLHWHRDMLAARDSRGCRLHQLANFVFTPGLGEYASSKLPVWATPAYRLARVARVLGLTLEKALG